VSGGAGLYRSFSDYQLTEYSVAAGAKLVLDESAFPDAKEGTALVGPQVLTNVDHSELR
jgi:hypothetical protein